MAGGEKEIVIDTLCPGEVHPDRWEYVWSLLARSSGQFLQGHREAVEQGRATLYFIRREKPLLAGFFVLAVDGTDLHLLSAVGKGLVNRDTAALVRHMAAANECWRVIATVRDKRLARLLRWLDFWVVHFGDEYRVEALAA